MDQKKNDIHNNINYEMIENIRSISSDGHGQEILINVINMYLLHTPKMLHELDAAYIANDFDKMSLIGHSIKSTSKQLGLLELPEIAFRLENVKENPHAQDIASIISDLHKSFDDAVVTLEMLKTESE